MTTHTTGLNQQIATTLTVKFGDALMQGGFTAMPNLLLKLFAELGITPTELVFIEQIWLYWYEKQENMFPSLSTIAQQMGLTRRQIRSYVSSLKEKQYTDKDTDYQSQPYLQIRERYATSGGQLSNQYDFSGLLDAVIFLAKKKGLISDPASDALSDPPRKFSTQGSRTKTSEGARKKVAYKEDEDEEDELQEDENSSKKALKDEVKAHSQREHVATGNRGEQHRKQSGRSSPTQKHPPVQRRIAKIEEHKQKPTIGKPLTQDEIDEKRRQGKNASGLTPLAGIIPPEHWQELETKSGKPSNGSTHYNNRTKHAPVFIDAIIEQFSTLLGDDPENIPININRAAKLYRQVGMSEDDFRAVMHEALDQAKRYPSSKIKKQRSDGQRPNRMPVFFTIFEKRLAT